MTGGQQATLTATAEANAPIASTTITVGATASIDTMPVTRSVGFALAVVPGGRTALIGRFMLIDGPPLQGVKLTLAGQTTETDSGGNFQLLDPPAGTQNLGVDTSPVGPGFPLYSVDVDLTSGQTTVLPTFEISPPPPAQTFTPIQNTTQDVCAAALVCTFRPS